MSTDLSFDHSGEDAAIGDTWDNDAAEVPAIVDLVRDASNAWGDPDSDATSSHALFADDQGGLSLAQRKALVVLMKHRFITAHSHPGEWRALIAAPARIAARLHDMFLDVHIDLEREVAFKFQVTAEAGDRFPTLLHRTDWNREETLLMMHLRVRAHAAFRAGEERVSIEREDLMEKVAQMRPDRATNMSRDSRRTEKAIEALGRAGLLVEKQDGDRWEIPRAIEVLLPLDTLQELSSWLDQDESLNDRELVSHEETQGQPPEAGERVEGVGADRDSESLIDDGLEGV